MTHVLLRHLPGLRLSANKAMWEAWHNAKLDKGTPREVDCIKVLINDAVPRIQNAWHGIFSNAGINLTLHGVVCHGHPWVNYPGASKRCELGDFLLVHDHCHPSGTVARRQAAIVQAKMFHNDGVRAKNKQQFDLYTKWPRFTYESWPGGLSRLDELHAKVGWVLSLPARLERDLRSAGGGIGAVGSSSIDAGCRYGMIDAKHSRWGDPQNGMNPWRLCSAQATDLYKSHDGVTLGRYLVDLLANQAGRFVPFTDWPAIIGGGCHWSLMVSELLSILPTAPQPTSGVSFMAMTPSLVSVLGNGTGTPTEIAELPQNGGFGVLHATTSGDME